jgi:hypothetical protein
VRSLGGRQQEGTTSFSGLFDDLLRLYNPNSKEEWDREKSKLMFRYLVWEEGEGEGERGEGRGEGEEGGGGRREREKRGGERGRGRGERERGGTREDVTFRRRMSEGEMGEGVDETSKNEGQGKEEAKGGREGNHLISFLQTCALEICKPLEEGEGGPEYLPQEEIKMKLRNKRNFKQGEWQEAINAAAPGDMILFHAGKRREEGKRREKRGGES